MPADPCSCRPSPSACSCHRSCRPRGSHRTSAEAVAAAPWPTKVARTPLRGSQLDHAGTCDHLARPGPTTEPPTRLRLSLQPNARSVGDPRLARRCARDAFGGADDLAVADHDHCQRHRLGRSNRRRTARGGEQTRKHQGSDPPADRSALGPSPQGEKTTPSSSTPRCLGADHPSSSALRTADRRVSRPGRLGRPGRPGHPGGRCRAVVVLSARSRSRCCRCARGCGRRSRYRAASSPSSCRLSQGSSSGAA